MKADPADQLRLLELQELDSRLSTLARRRASLPEIAQLATLSTELDGLADQAVLARTRVQDLARSQGKLETDVDLVRQRMARDQQRLDSGAVSASKELVDLQSEIESLHRRQTVLEDEELEIMEAREEAERELAGIDSARTVAEAGAVTAQQRLEFGRVDIDTEAALTGTRRDQVLPTVPADLVVLYDKIRSAAGGVGVALLSRRRCGGCHLELAGSELREVAAAAPDEIVRCENCRRIFVRTAESGL